MNKSKNELLKHIQLSQALINKYFTILTSLIKKNTFTQARLIELDSRINHIFLIKTNSIRQRGIQQNNLYRMLKNVLLMHTDALGLYDPYFHQLDPYIEDICKCECEAAAKGFWDSIINQLYSMTHPFANDAYQNSALGQSLNGPWWSYYGTRTSLWISSITISLAAIIGTCEFTCLGNESFLTIESNQTNLLRILSKPLRKGFRVDRPDFHKPFYHVHFWSW
jgi:hypothetical protein